MLSRAGWMTLAMHGDSQASNRNTQQQKPGMPADDASQLLFDAVRRSRHFLTADNLNDIRMASRQMLRRATHCQSTAKCDWRASPWIGVQQPRPSPSGNNVSGTALGGFPPCVKNPGSCLPFEVAGVYSGCSCLSGRKKITRSTSGHISVRPPLGAG